VLQEIKARFDAVPGLYLLAIEQKEGEITIKGESPNEYSVTKFGQSLEFSGGLFSNLNIETQREVARDTKDVTSTVAALNATTLPVASDANVIKPEVVVFTVKASFATSKSQSQAAPAPANQVALKK
jgi:hypothetical protein